MEKMQSVQLSEFERQQRKKLRFYKPFKTLNGSALQLDLNAEKESVFMEFSRQLQEKSFDWQNKMVFKLSVPDICKILTLLNGRMQSLNLYHDPSKGNYALAEEMKNAALTASKTEKGILLKISQQARDNTINAISINLADDECVLLQIMLEKAVEAVYEW